MQRIWTQAPASCKATMRNCRRMPLSFCFDIVLYRTADCFKRSNVEVAKDLLVIFNMWIVVQHCMTERLEYLEGKLGDSADKHSKAASGCAVLNVATILWSLMLPMSAPVALTVLTFLLPCCSLPSHELSNTEAKMRELSGPQDMTRRLDRRTLRCWIMILLRRHSLSGIFQYLVDSLPFHCPIHPWSQQDHPIYADILVSKAWQVTRWKEQPGRSQWGKSSKLVDVVLFFLNTFHLRSFIIGKKHVDGNVFKIEVLRWGVARCSRLKSYQDDRCTKIRSSATLQALTERHEGFLPSPCFAVSAWEVTHNLAYTQNNPMSIPGWNHMNIMSPTNWLVKGCFYQLIELVKGAPGFRGFPVTLYSHWAPFPLTTWRCLACRPAFCQFVVRTAPCMGVSPSQFHDAVVKYFYHWHCRTEMHAI